MKRGGVIYRNKFTENFSDEDIPDSTFLLRKNLLDFNLPLKKQVAMSNSNTFQPNVNIFIKSDLRIKTTRQKIIIIPFFQK